jgi:hypothetical protein
VEDKIRSPSSRIQVAAASTLPAASIPTMSKLSSLASVVRNRTWKADDDETPLALFHKKFWGKSMKDEESEWHRSQIKIDQDQDEITDMDDDIVPGCYVLDISIPGMQVSQLWIRADYIRVFDYFQTFYDTHARPMEKVPSGVLTGQPGIGESPVLLHQHSAQGCAVRQEFLDLLRRSSLRS